jgi:hypothetical protein
MLSFYIANIFSTALADLFVYPFICKPFIAADIRALVFSNDKKGPIYLLCSGCQRQQGIYGIECNLLLILPQRTIICYHSLWESIS